MSPLERRIADLEGAARGRDLVRVVPGHIERDDVDAWCAADRARPVISGSRSVYVFTGVPRPQEAA